MNKGQAEAMEFSGPSILLQGSTLAVVEDPPFTKFPEFPMEIRLKIWKDALPGPRIVHYDSCDLVSTSKVCHQRALTPWSVH